MFSSRRQVRDVTVCVTQPDRESVAECPLLCFTSRCFRECHLTAGLPGQKCLLGQHRVWCWGRAWGAAQGWQPVCTLIILSAPPEPLLHPQNPACTLRSTGMLGPLGDTTWDFSSPSPPSPSSCSCRGLPALLAQPHCRHYHVCWQRRGGSAGDSAPPSPAGSPGDASPGISAAVVSCHVAAEGAAAIAGSPLTHACLKPCGSATAQVRAGDAPAPSTLLGWWGQLRPRTPLWEAQRWLCGVT